MPKICVVIPTYNERDNIIKLLDEIFGLGVEGLKVVVVDDDSPDGTSFLVKEYTRSNRDVILLRRFEQKGRGLSGIAGLKYALRLGAEFIIEMDADFSHHPRYIPKMLEAVQDCDLVLGSRFVKGGRLVRKGVLRNLISFLANYYIRLILKIDIRDATSGFRCFSRKVLEGINLDNTISLGPSVVQELLYKSCLKGFKIKEIPVEFIDRYRGQSTFNIKIALQGLLMVLILKYFFSHIRKTNFIEVVQSGDSSCFK